MYYRLQDHLALRGWKGIPYGIIDTRTGGTAFLDAAAFQAVSFCDGNTHFASPLILPAHREVKDKLLAAGIIRECAAGEGLADWQKYRLSPGRYAASVHWSITGRCNLRCRHCYMSAPQAKYGELTTDECLSIIDQMAAANIGRVSLTGGEPLVRDDFWQLVDAIRDRQIVITQIYTNGVLVTDDLLSGLKARGIQCEFSLSFDCVDCHDWMRGVPGAEQAAIEAIRRARREGFAVSIETALHKGNLHKLKGTYELLKDWGVCRWKTSPAVNVGNWAQEGGQYDLSLDELYEVYLSLITRHYRDKAPLGLMLGGFYHCSQGSADYSIPVSRFDGTEQALRQTACRSCRINPYIMADGRLLPCIPITGTYIEDKMPSLLTTSIAAALTDSEYFRVIDTRLEEICRTNPACTDCEHLLRCGMGCRAAALYDTGRYDGIDAATCHIFKNGYEEKIKNARS